MREIKFRAWDKETNEMGYFGLNDIYWRGENTGEYDFPSKKDELMQFTGLHDKNGKEIYEGDIVKAKSPIYHKLGETNWKVVWKDAGFVLKHYLQDARTSIIPDDCEIIGNIYENPELLK